MLGSEVAPVRGDLSGAEPQPDRSGLARMREFTRAAFADASAAEKVINGRRHRCRHQPDRDAGSGRRFIGESARACRARASDAMYQLGLAPLSREVAGES